MWTPGSDGPQTPDHSPTEPLLQGQANFGDLGGYKARDGRTVIRGRVFRSGELPRLTNDDVAKLKQFGIRTVVNFLTEEEIEFRGEYIDASLDEAVKRYSSVENYIRDGLGLSYAEVQRLRSALLE